ncbi:hypothetical protein, partial [Corynebacterium flavescens]|uniref:hypothetical protein n=1 Tax=Corynebacterium flavescens TaxID=28028 RepID=UPI0026471A0B
KESGLEVITPSTYPEMPLEIINDNHLRHKRHGFCTSQTSRLAPPLQKQAIDLSLLLKLN